ncbi:MAG: ABC-F family ATP-binding cassette domain-containing protein [Methanomassiliicoccales archaeon]
MSKSFGKKDVLKSVTAIIEPGDRIGLVGSNGSGKSTLLRLLVGEIKPDTGEIEVRTSKIGYLPQFESEEGIIQDFCLDPKQKAKQARLEELEQLMMQAASDTSIDMNTVVMEYDRLLEELASGKDHSVEEFRNRAKQQLGIPDNLWNSSFQGLSGGEQTKMRLARLMMQAEDAELLILDEPTSHLDIEGTQALEEFLLRYKGALVVVSHDRYFLNSMVSTIWDLDDGKLREYRGNYSDFVEKKKLEKEKLRLAEEKLRHERDRLLKAAEEQHLRNRYGRAHKAMIRRAERLTPVETIREEGSISFQISTADKHGKAFIRAKNLLVARGKQKILDMVDFELNLGDKLGVFGPNGSGKTSLLKVLNGELPYLGELWISPAAKIGYFSQSHDGLDERLTPEEQLLQVLGKDDRAAARSILAKLLFDDLKVKTPIEKLSGGERAKVAIALLICEQRNLLLLDEPNNYLDVASREALEEALKEYPGTLILVTHDRYLLDAICNRVAELRGGMLRFFNGTYSQMQGVWRQEEYLTEAQVYRVVSGFTDWTTRKKLRSGDTIAIAPSELEFYKWAFDNGKLKKLDRKEYKKVKKVE